MVPGQEISVFCSNILTSFNGFIRVSGVRCFLVPMLQRGNACHMGFRAYAKKEMNKLMTLGVVLMMFCLLGPGFTSGAYGGPLEAETGRDVANREVNQDGPGSNVGAWLVSLFSEHISAVDGDRCPSEPTCSSYSVQAFKKHGLVLGWLMTVDRLIHEGDEWTVSTVKNRNGKGKIIDPIENNDFWWYSDNAQHSPR